MIRKKQALKYGLAFLYLILLYDNSHKREVIRFPFFFVSSLLLKKGNFGGKGEFQGVFCKPFYFSIRIESLKYFIYKKIEVYKHPLIFPLFPLFDFCKLLLVNICSSGDGSQPLPNTLFDFAVFIRRTLPPFTQKRSVEIQAAPSYCSRPKFGRSSEQAAASLVSRSCCWRVISRLAETTLTAVGNRPRRRTGGL